MISFILKLVTIIIFIGVFFRTILLHSITAIMIVSGLIFIFSDKFKGFTYLGIALVVIGIFVLIGDVGMYFRYRKARGTSKNLEKK